MASHRTLHSRLSPLRWSSCTTAHRCWRLNGDFKNISRLYWFQDAEHIYWNSTLNFKKSKLRNHAEWVISCLSPTHVHMSTNRRSSYVTPDVCLFFGWNDQISEPWEDTLVCRTWPYFSLSIFKGLAVSVKRDQVRGCHDLEKSSVGPCWEYFIFFNTSRITFIQKQKYLYVCICCSP